MSATNTAQPNVFPLVTTVSDIETSIKSVKTIDTLFSSYYLTRVMDANPTIIHGYIQDAVDKAHEAIMPLQSTQNALAFEANPHNEINKAHIRDMLEWCSAAEEFYHSQASIVLRVIDEKQKIVRDIRTQMERAIADTEAREIIHNTIWVQLDKRSIAGINRMPHEIVSLIGEFLPKNLRFSVCFPSIEEMKTTLSKVTIRKLKNFLEYIEDRNDQEEDVANPDEFRKNIVSIMLKAYRDQIITTDDICPYMNGEKFPTKKKDKYIMSIVGYVRVYEYYANIFKTAAAKPDFKMQKEYNHYANVLQDEALHTIKFMRFLSKPKKGTS